MEVLHVTFDAATVISEVICAFWKLETGIAFDGRRGSVTSICVATSGNVCRPGGDVDTVPQKYHDDSGDHLVSCHAQATSVDACRTHDPRI
jgi:hypothetical protein